MLGYDRVHPFERSGRLYQLLGVRVSQVFIFLVVAAVAADAMRKGWWDTAGWLSLFNVLLNAYPVLSLRYVRVRVERIFG